MDSATPEVLLSVDDVLETLNAVTGLAIVEAATNALVSFLFAEPLNVTANGKEYNLKTAERTRIEEFYRPFTIEAFKISLFWGITPYIPSERHRTADLTGKTYIVPVVPVFGTYVITTYTEGGVQKYRTYGFRPADISRSGAGAGHIQRGDAGPGESRVLDYGVDEYGEDIRLPRTAAEYHQPRRGNDEPTVEHAPARLG